MLDQLPLLFVQTIRQTFGEDGRTWLQNLPALLAKVCSDYGLVTGDPFDLSYNYVAAAQQENGREVVLKLGVPNPALISEIAALRLYNGRGAVQLIEADVARGLILLERVRPGDTMHRLSIKDDGAATEQVAQVMAQLWRPLPDTHTFPSIIEWGDGFNRLRQRFAGTSGPLPAVWVERAEKMYVQAAAGSASYRLLHGDLHHGNVISATKQPWLAIDPKGVAGPPYL